MVGSQEPVPVSALVSKHSDKSQPELTNDIAGQKIRHPSRKLYLKVLENIFADQRCSYDYAFALHTRSQICKNSPMSSLSLYQQRNR